MKRHILSLLHSNNKKSSFKCKIIVDVKTCTVISMPDTNSLKGIYYLYASHRNKNLS